MDPLIAPGQRLRLLGSGATVTVGRRIGAGGQGVVHVVALGEASFAVKWFRPSLRQEGFRACIEALVRRGRPPHGAFVWPIDLVEAADAGPEGFGYLMRLVEPRFVPIPQVLNERQQPSFRVLATIGRELVEAMAALHATGLCYRDFSFGNVWVDPATAQIAVLDNDNIGSEGGEVFVKGTGRFMAPEILRDEALPSTVTDLHSLAVLLFFVLVHGHPLLGARVDSSYTWEGGGHLTELELLLEHFGRSPLFVFDPADAANRPVPGDRMLVWWSLYPEFVRQVFTRAFTVGLRDASLGGRVTEGVWRRALLRLHDSVWACPRCGAEVFHDPDRPGSPCWACRLPLPVPPLLHLPNGRELVLGEGAEVTDHHLAGGRGQPTVLGRVEPHPGRPGRVVLRNVGDRAWRVAPDGETLKAVHPGQRLGVRPMGVDFGPARGWITAGEA
ncbi:DNA-binding helix-hairpin-helix protein with protein kinase domain [Streptacidiphilus sp. MAP12-33]|uniref:protein kinase domain-containing protein n=1 Tax=Streptacidiphilus sp. MAP12-33 TaxID=3156266 RepID=UPI00351386AD